MIRIKHPDVGATDTGCRELGVVRNILATMRRCDERAAPPGTREDDVARLVANQQRPDHPAHGTHRTHGTAAVSIVAGSIVVGPAGDLHDAHAVRQLIDYPGLVVGNGGNRDGFQAHGNRPTMVQAILHYSENLQPVVRCIGCIQRPSAW